MMKRNKTKLLYLFRNSIKNDLSKAKNGQIPKDYFYFYHEFKKKFNLDFATVASDNFFVKLFHLVIDHTLNLIIGINFPLITILPLLKRINRSQFVFATTPKTGLSLGLLKKLRLINKPRIVMNICGLYDQFINKQNSFNKRVLKSWLLEVDLFISGSSWHECELLASNFNLDITLFRFAPYSGIDIDFFKPAITSADKYILGIGIDPARDWKLYRQVALSFPNEKFLFATQPALVKLTMPKNVRLQYFENANLVEKIRNSKIVLILNNQNQHFSGQASAMRCMSCSKAVILTKTPGVEEFRFKHLINCILVDPGNLKQIVSHINALNQQDDLKEHIGKNASTLIRTFYNYKIIANQYISIFQQLVH